MRRRAERPRRLDELALAQRAHLGADDAREPGPDYDADRQDRPAVRPGPEHAGEDDRDEQQREAPGQVDQAATRRVSTMPPK